MALRIYIGMLEGLIAARWMMDASHAWGIEGEELIKRYFQTSKE